MKIKDNSHKNSIWTWRSGKVSVWLPYLSEVTKVKKNHWLFKYNGGELEADLEKVDFVLFYGASCDVPLTLFDDFNKFKITAILHRRGMPKPYIFHTSDYLDSAKDTLTKQILFRENNIKRTFIAKTLIRERLKSFEYLIPIPDTRYKKLRAEKDIKAVMVTEAEFTKKYWQAFSKELGLSADWNRRDKGDPVVQALDAGSYFLMGIILRWVLFHKMSPSHGFLHTPTTYSSLVYDLMEPYRYLIEKAVIKAYSHGGNDDLTEKTIHYLKQALDDWCYLPSHKGQVRRKNLLHGVVLALRAYLQGESRLIVVPVEGEKNGGRPVKTGYEAPGLKK